MYVYYLSSIIAFKSNLINRRKTRGNDEFINAIHPTTMQYIFSNYLTTSTIAHDYYCKANFFLRDSGISGGGGLGNLKTTLTAS